MKRVLWVGDAACDSGFARCTHRILDVVKDSWDVVVLGINYRGDPHDYPYKIWPAINGGDPLGLGRFVPMVKYAKPDLIVLQNDPWNIPYYTKALEAAVEKKQIDTAPPMLGFIAIDGKNCVGTKLNDLTGAAFWTDFAVREAQQGGYTGPSYVVPLGVDTDVYYPTDQREARVRLQLNPVPLDAFIVGNINRNQPRKRLDLTLEYFFEWVKEYDHDDAYLFLHVSPTGDVGYDVEQLAKYYGVPGRLILQEPGVYKGVTEAYLADTYRSFDLQMSTTQGEGWGLTTMEGMACGVPQIVPAWSALLEWAGSAAWQVPCSSTAVTWGGPNAIGGIADKAAFIEGLETLYREPERRKLFAEAGLNLVRSESFKWENIGAAFERCMLETARVVPA